ncbi:hypothetical protein G6W41_09935, partial [Campylobacter concisus]|uniref:Ig-like domain-containing protein n=2 Tax=Campylobacter concisus TaxID=199 RepID=UPI001883963A
TVTFPDGSTDTAKVNDDGSWEVPTSGHTPLKPGETVTATAEDNGGSSNPVNSNPTTDVTPAKDPTINPIDNDDTTVSGKVPNAEPNTTVTVKFPDGSTATTTVDNNGNWTVPTPGNNPLTPGSTVTATAEDNGGSSNPVNSNPTTDVTPAKDPTINPIDNDDTTVSGKVPNAEPNTTVTVKFPDGSTATTTVDNNGNWTVPTPGNNPLTPGSTVTATAEDNGGSSNPVNSNPTTDVVPPHAELTPNPDGTVSVVSHDGDASKVEISYTDNNGNPQTITVVKNPSAGWVVDSTPGKTTAPATDFTLDPHSGKVVVSDNATKDGTSITAKVTDNAGNSSEDSATTPDKISIKFNDDTTPDGIITRAENYADEGTKATATISIPNLAKDGSKIKISGTGINDGEFTVHKDASGNVISVTDSNNKNVFDGNNGFTIAYKYTAGGSNVNITAQLDNTALKTTGSVKFENVKMADVEFVELDSHGNVLSDKKTTNTDTVKGYNRAEAALDGDINHTTARISLPDNVQDGDVITVKYGFGPNAASLAATGGTDTTAYKYFLVHKAADGSMTVDQITSATDKTVIKSGLTSTNGAGEKFGIDIHDMPTAVIYKTTSRGIEVSIKGEDDASVSMNPRWTNRGRVEPEVVFVEGNKTYTNSQVGDGANPNSGGMKLAEAMRDGDIDHTTARVVIKNGIVDGDKITVSITDFNKIYADTGVKVYPSNNPAPTEVKTFIAHKAADGTVTFDEVDASGHVIHAGIPSVNNNAIDIPGIGMMSISSDKFVHATEVTAKVSDTPDNELLNGNENVSSTSYVFLENISNVQEPTITTIYDDFGSTTGDVSKNGKTDDKTPELKGKAEKFATVEIFDGTHSLGTTKADKDGNWNFTPKTPLNDGEHNFTAKTIIGGVSSNASDGYAITIDNTIGTIEARFVEDGNNDGRLTYQENMSDGNRKSTSLELKVSGSFEDGDKITLHLDDPIKGSGDIVLKKVGNSAVVESASESLKGMAPIGAAAPINNGVIMISKIGMLNGQKTIAKAYITDDAGNKSNVATDEFTYVDREIKPVQVVDTLAVWGNNRVGLLLESDKMRDTELQSHINGNNDYKLDVKTITNYSHLTFGDGNDEITVHTKGGGWGNIFRGAELNLGGGDNKLTVERDIDAAKVTAGSGDDTVTVHHWVRADSTIDLGAGDNKLTVDDQIYNSTVTTKGGNDEVSTNGLVGATINLGAGDDTIKVGQIIGNSNINGGDGYDKLAITNPGTNVDLSNIANKAHNFEELDISNKGQNTTLNVKLSDVINLTDNDNILKITADAGDKVAFKDGGWQKGASADGYTTYTNDTTGTTVTVEIKDEVTQPM